MLEETDKSPIIIRTKLCIILTQHSLEANKDRVSKNLERNASYWQWYTLEANKDRVSKNLETNASYWQWYTLELFRYKSEKKDYQISSHTVLWFDSKKFQQLI